jgi:putative DNA primase/helicase
MFRQERWPKARSEAFAETATLIELQTIETEAIVWAWRNYLPRGKLALIAGAPGTGKTTIALFMAATISAGERWPDGTLAKEGIVVIWSSEDKRPIPSSRASSAWARRSRTSRLWGR